MEIRHLLAESRAIWGDECLSLAQVIVRLGVVFGDLCRFDRNASKYNPSRNET